jgi:hypothetical protein
LHCIVKRCPHAHVGHRVVFSINSNVIGQISVQTRELSGSTTLGFRQAMFGQSRISTHRSDREKFEQQSFAVDSCLTDRATAHLLTHDTNHYRAAVYHSRDRLRTVLLTSGRQRDVIPACRTKSDAIDLLTNQSRRKSFRAGASRFRDQMRAIFNQASREHEI